MLQEQLKQNLFTAMKAKDAVTTGALRLVLSNAKNKQIDLGHQLSDPELQAVIEREVKQRRYDYFFLNHSFTGNSYPTPCM